MSQGHMYDQTHHSLMVWVQTNYPHEKQTNKEKKTKKANIF